jgi:hypothetical protein
MNEFVQKVFYTNNICLTEIDGRMKYAKLEYHDNQNDYRLKIEIKLSNFDVELTYRYCTKNNTVKTIIKNKVKFDRADYCCCFFKNQYFEQNNASENYLYENIQSEIKTIIETELTDVFDSIRIEYQKKYGQKLLIELDIPKELKFRQVTTSTI